MALAEEGFNSELYYKTKDFRKTVNIVPTSGREVAPIRFAGCGAVVVVAAWLWSSLVFIAFAFFWYPSCALMIAHTGEGIPDLLFLIVQLTQKLLTNEILFTEELDASVLDVKTTPGFGG